MTLSRLTNYVDGNVLTGAQLNNEFDNILNNGPSLVSAAIPGVSIVQGLQGSMISNIGSFQANGYQLKSTSTIATLTATSSYSINTQTVGPIANGRDQAAAFASTTVHFYAITTGGTSTSAAGICSTRPPTIGPTLPAGYSAWAYLASGIYTVATSVLTRTVVLTGARASLGAPAGGAGVAVTTEVVTGLGAFIPSIATHHHLGVAYTLSGSGGAGPSGIISLGVLSSPAGTTYTLNPTFSNDVGGCTIGGMYFATLPNIETTPTVYSRIQPNGPTTGTLRIDVVGYTVPNGDVG